MAGAGVADAERLNGVTSQVLSASYVRGVFLACPIPVVHYQVVRSCPTSGRASGPSRLTLPGLTRLLPGIWRSWGMDKSAIKRKGGLV